MNETDRPIDMCRGNIRYTPEIDIKSTDIEKVTPRLLLSDWVMCL